MQGGPARLGAAELSEQLQRMRSRTPARILVGRAGASYRTATQLELRVSHAVARDAAHAELELERDLGPQFIEAWRLFGVETRASTRQEYLTRPDLGRQFTAEAATEISHRCVKHAAVQVVIGDGLSPAAAVAQVPAILPLLAEGTARHGWQFGQPFFVRYCRVGILNGVGEILDPEVVVLLIGERPGLATTESLSAYLAYRPRAGHTDAQRNVISNIHVQGVDPTSAVERILRLADAMMNSRVSGVALKETEPAAAIERGRAQ
jgi:ethanolamine ammonia-lyase small subunit